MISYYYYHNWLVSYVYIPLRPRPKNPSRQQPEGCQVGKQAQLLLWQQEQTEHSGTLSFSFLRIQRDLNSTAVADDS